MAPWRMGRVVLALAALTPPAVPWAGAPAVYNHTATYDLYLGGVWAGEVSIDAAFEAASYRATASITTGGAVGLLFGAKINAASEGELSADGLRPQHFSSATKSAWRKRSIEILYDDDAPASVRAEPAFEPQPWSLDPRAQRGATDPLSAALAAFAPRPLHAACGRRIEAFDGERRFAIEIGPPQREADGIRCEAVYIRVAGYKPRLIEQWTDRPLTLFLAERADGLVHVVRAVSETAFGPAVLMLRQ